jgi:hypothetical protein
MAKKSSRQSTQRRARKGRVSMLFTLHNYLLLIIGVVAVVIGYTTMRIENEVDGFISLYVAPLLILGGYLEIIYAILWRPKQEDAETA